MPRHRYRYNIDADTDIHRYAYIYIYICTYTHTVRDIDISTDIDTDMAKDLYRRHHLSALQDGGQLPPSRESEGRPARLEICAG